MQPLQALHNVQKAKLLHALFYQEIPAFLTYTAAVCQDIEDDPQSFRDNWVEQLITADLWLTLEAETHRRIKRYGRELERSSSAFSDQLFDGYGAIFMTNCLLQYTASGKNTDPKFKTGVELFFQA